MIIAVDFDGTLVRGSYPSVDGLMPYALETMRALKKQGHYLIINTCRTGEELLIAINLMLEKGIPFDRVNDNHPDNTRKYNSNSRKIYAHVYIDDKNLGGFPGWLNVAVEVRRMDDEWNQNNSIDNLKSE